LKGAWRRNPQCLILKTLTKKRKEIGDSETNKGRGWGWMGTTSNPKTKTRKEMRITLDNPHFTTWALGKKGVQAIKRIDSLTASK